MIIKNQESAETKVSALQSLLELALAPRQQLLVEQTLACVQANEKSEDNPSYYVNYRLKESPDWMVLHDLQLEHEGMQVHLDHLLINRQFELYILNSTYYPFSLNVSPYGEFTLDANSHEYPIESPIEVNKRHAFFLEQFLNRNRLLPRKAGIPLKPALRGYVLCSPKSAIKRPRRSEFNTDSVIKSDTLQARLDEEKSSGLVTMARKLSNDSLIDFAKSLKRAHAQSSAMTYYFEQFSIKSTTPKRTLADLANPAALAAPAQNSPGQPSEKISASDETAHYCAGCGVSINRKTLLYCHVRTDRFGGKAYCPECQKHFTAAANKKGTATSCIRVKRIYEQPSPADGMRVLVDRMWPQGLTKAEAKLDLWLKEAAPSAELRQWFHRDRSRWSEFKEHYYHELNERHDALAHLKTKIADGPITLLFGSEDLQQNTAVALKEYLENQDNIKS